MRTLRIKAAIVFIPAFQPYASTQKLQKFGPIRASFDCYEQASEREKERRTERTASDQRTCCPW